MVNKVRTPIFPPYSEVHHLLGILPGVLKVEFTRMIAEIHEQMGTPQNPVDWTDPDIWITQRLTGASAELALRIWVESGKLVNPRHTRGSYYFINNFELLDPDGQGVYQLTDRGKAFLDRDAPTIQEIDDLEGIGELLSILAAKTRAMRGDLLPEWGDFLHEYSTFGSPSTIKDTLRRRLFNLVDRGLITRDGNSYLITQAGIDYAASFAQTGEADPKREVLRVIATYNQTQQERLRDALATMSPFQFEHLIGDLLEAMGYEEVEVTKQSGDKGVDVVASIQYGITNVTEVVQVKRQKSSIARPVLDQLRGALPYHKAIRGTIITLSTFTKGCLEVAHYPGAAPITLIDGTKLIELLIQHEVGIERKPAYIFDLDEEYFESVAGEPDSGDLEIAKYAVAGGAR